MRIKWDEDKRQIVEFRSDKIGEYIWVVAAWNSTKQEGKRYEAETR